jgi:hypothetical protein
MGTIAEQIAARFGDDGQQWEDADGVALWDACKAAGGSADQFWELEATRYEFDDGSALVLTPGGWDIGMPGTDRRCICWPSVGVGGCDCPEHG